MKLSTIHPFPARMAPELACYALGKVPNGGRVLDPMCGSGTVARAAVESGLQCIGVDIDPLSVLMSRVWTTRLEPGRIRADAECLVREAGSLPSGAVERTTDRKTRDFISYWFAPKQESELARLTTVLGRQERPTDGALAISLSRIIVSKEMMASLARDTSHSRPHKVAQTNDFDVYTGFLRSSRLVADRLLPNLIEGQADIRRGDARTLEDVSDGQFDLALTSPPYLNAIDYLRGHRLALVWMGHVMASLRETRSASVGAERILPDVESPTDISPYVIEGEGSTIGSRHRGWIRRYAADMEAVLRQIDRTLKRTGRVVMVLGNSFIRGAKVNNAGLVEELAIRIGFRLEDRQVREIPARRRYLPPPGDGQNALDARMRTETVLTLRPTA